MDMDAVTVALEGAGFKHDDELKGAHEESATSNEMHTGGPYVIHGVWRKGLVSIVVEQNTDTIETDGMSVSTTHPPVAVVQGPKGRAGCNPSDADLLLSLAVELA